MVSNFYYILQYGQGPLRLPGIVSKLLGQLCLLKELSYPPMPLNKALSHGIASCVQKVSQNQLIQLAAIYLS